MSWLELISLKSVPVWSKFDKEDVAKPSQTLLINELTQAEL